MSVAEMPRLSTKQKIEWIVMLVVLAVLALIPCGPVYTLQVKEFLIISVAGIVMMALELVPAYVAAIFLPMAFWFLKVAEPTVVFNAWTQEIPWVVLGSLLVAVIMNKTGLSKRLAYGMMILGRGNFYAVLAMMVVAGCITTFFVPAAVARGALFGAIALSLTDAMGWENNKKHTILLFTAVQLAATATSYMVMTGTNSDFVVAGALESAGYPVSWGQWAYYNLIPGVIEIIIVFIIICFVYRNHDTGNTKEMDSKAMHTYIKGEYQKLGKPSKQEIKAIILFVVILIMLLTSSYHSMSPGKTFMLMALIAFLPGVNLLTGKDGKSINYTTLFLVTSCVAIGDVANELGLGTLFVDKIMPMLPHSTLALTAVVFALCFFGNMLMTPVALASACTLPIINIALALDQNPFGLVMLWWTACGATVFPYEATADLLIFGYGKMSMKEWIKIGLIRSATLFVTRFVLYIPWFKIIGIL